MAKTKTKSAAKNKPTAKRGARKAPRSRVSAPKKTKAAPKKAAPIRGETLGEVVAPSGKLAIFDIGLFGFLPREALEPALIIADVPGKSLPVIGRRVGKGRFTDCWESVIVPLAGGEPTHARKLGEAGVDFARLILIDHAALAHWVHEDSLDGKADFVFWGRDAAALAKRMRAPSTKEGYGWVDVSVADAEAKSDLAAKYKAENRWLLATDLRPHSHHFEMLAAARASTTGAGTLALAGGQALMFFTSWGDGVFPVYLDLDANDVAAQIRIQLAPTDAVRA